MFSMETVLFTLSDLFFCSWAHGEIEGLSKGRGCEAFSFVTKRMQPNKEEVRQAEFIMFAWEIWRIHPEEVREMYKIKRKAERLTKKLLKMEDLK